MNQEASIKEKLSKEIMKIMTLDSNKANYTNFRNVIKDLQPKSCKVKFGWCSGKAIEFVLSYEKDENENPYDEFIENIEDKYHAYYFIMGLCSTIFHFNQKFVVNAPKHLLLMFKLKRNE